MKSRPAVRPPSTSPASQPHPGCVQAQRPSMFLKNQCIRNRGKRVLSPHNSRNASSPCVAVRAVSPGQSSPKSRRPKSVRLVARVVSPFTQAASNRAPACQARATPVFLPGQLLGQQVPYLRTSKTPRHLLLCSDFHFPRQPRTARWEGIQRSHPAARQPGILELFSNCFHLEPKNSERKRRLSGLSGSSDALEPIARGALGYPA